MLSGHYQISVEATISQTILISDFVCISFVGHWMRILWSIKMQKQTWYGLLPISSKTNKIFLKFSHIKFSINLQNWPFLSIMYSPWGLLSWLVTYRWATSTRLISWSNGEFMSWQLKFCFFNEKVLKGRYVGSCRI